MLSFCASDHVYYCFCGSKSKFSHFMVISIPIIYSTCILLLLWVKKQKCTFEVSDNIYIQNTMILYIYYGYRYYQKLRMYTFAFLPTKAIVYMIKILCHTFAF